MKTRGKSNLWKFLPWWAILPLLTIWGANSLIYWGSDVLTSSLHHYDFTMAVDRLVPFVPEFIWIYVLAFPFWGLNYILAAQQGKEAFWRFVATDLTIHAICFVFFVLLPTTNVRPEILGDSLSEQFLAYIYSIDGGNSPSNLFPSIHCYVSWLCVYAVKDQKKIPRWYKIFSVVFAVLIIISTQTLKQHYWIDAAAGVLLVEFFWRFYQKGYRYKPFEKFFGTCNKWIFQKLGGKILKRE